MQEAGLIEKWQKRWWSDKTRCSDHVPHREPLTLQNVAGPYYIFLGFVAVGVICLGFECLVNFFKKHQKKGNTKVIRVTDVIEITESQLSV